MTVACVDLGPAGGEDAVARSATFVDELSRRDHVSAVIAFSNRAEVLSDPSLLRRPVDAAARQHELARPELPDDPAAGGSALASALRLAGVQVPAGTRGTIELWSAGLPTRGDAEAEAFRLARRGIAIRHVAADVLASTPVAIVRAVRVPGGARVGQTVTAEIDVEAKAAGPARLMLTTEPGTTIVQDVELAAGSGRMMLPLTLHDAGVVRVSARMGDGPVRSAAVAVGPAASVIVVRDPRRGDRTGLNWGALLGDTANVMVVSPEVLASATYDTASAVVLDDLLPDALPFAAQQRLRTRVANGLSLFLAAGPASVPHDNAPDPLAALWPVRLPRQAQVIEPSVALVLILDTSGSMQGEPLELAKEVSRLAISHLKPADKVGIVEFYGGRRWAYPVQVVGDGVGVNRALAKLTPGGGSDLFPAVEEAGFSLRNVQAQARHVMVLSDGFVAGGPFAARVRQMAENGIATSAVQIGQSAEGQLMTSVALWGGGRFYSVPDRFALPDVSFGHSRTSGQSSVVRQATGVRSGDDPLTRADTRPWPDIGGYLRLTAKPTADVVLRGQSGDPLLTRWRWGDGSVAVMAVRPGDPLAAGLTADPRFASVIATLARGTGSAGGALRVRPIVRPAGLEVDVVATTRPDTSPLRLVVRDADDRAVRTMTCHPVSPGRWNALLTDLPSGTYTLFAATAIGRATAAAHLDAPVAVPGVLANGQLLDRVAAFSSNAVDPGPPAGRWVDLRAALIVAAVAMLVLHVALRRWPERNGGVK